MFKITFSLQMGRSRERGKHTPRNRRRPL